MRGTFMCICYICVNRRERVASRARPVPLVLIFRAPCRALWLVVQDVAELNRKLPTVMCHRGRHHHLSTGLGLHQGPQSRASLLQIGQPLSCFLLIDILKAFFFFFFFRKASVKWILNYEGFNTLGRSEMHINVIIKSLIINWTKFIRCQLFWIVQTCCAINENSLMRLHFCWTHWVELQVEVQV